MSSCILTLSTVQVYDYTTNEYQRSTRAMPSKMKTKYWLGKQQLRQKMGKEEDAWVVKGDSSLDAKLSYFHHVNHSCNELLRLCDRLQHYSKSLSHQVQQQYDLIVAVYIYKIWLEGLVVVGPAQLLLLCSFVALIHSRP